MSFRATPASRAVLRAALALSAVGAALGAGAGVAQAAELPGVGGALRGAATGLDSAVSPATHLKLDPMAGSTVDPLTNGAGVQTAGFKSLGTQTVTQPLTDGKSLSELPVVGPLTRLVAP